MIEFRRYEASDAEALGKLSRCVWKKDIPNEMWSWKYGPNPNGEQASYAAFDEGQMVGFTGSIPWRVAIHGRAFDATQGTDVMIHPEWRRKNVFFPLNRANQDSVEAEQQIHFGFTTPSSFRIWSKRYRYRGFQPRKMQRIVSHAQLLIQQGRSGHMPSPGMVVRRGAALLQQRAYKREPVDSKDEGYLIESIRSFDGRFDRFWSAQAEQFQIATVRTSGYLNWRYANHPVHQYSTLALTQGGALLGFAVLGTQVVDGIRRGIIVDFMVASGRASAADALVQACVKWFRDKRAPIVSGWMFEWSEPNRALRDAGFQEVDIDPIVFMAKTFLTDVNEVFLSDPRNWYLIRGDCEVF